MSAIDALKKMYPDSSRRTLQNWLKNGRFQLNSKRLEKENTPVLAGDVISSIETFQKPKVPRLKILYEDRYFIVIDKPVGLLSVPLDGGSVKKDALTLLREHYKTDQIFAVHRIDRETSGILMFARGKESEEKFDKLFENHDITREYFAIVEGRLEQEQGTWQSNLVELESFHVIESPEGKTATTHFSVIRRSQKYTYLKLRLETGRKHQIRVHCQMAGHPIVGDERYGSVESPMKRLCLHACTLGFIHPFTQKRVKFSSPLPAVFEVLGAKRGKQE
jgi:23S rRNA pseudouridine1911/1915/1917 synthase